MSILVGTKIEEALEQASGFKIIPSDGNPDYPLVADLQGNKLAPEVPEASSLRDKFGLHGAGVAIAEQTPVDDNSYTPSVAAEIQNTV